MKHNTLNKTTGLDKDVELRSEKIRNIIGQIPPVLLRYGTIIIGVALAILIVVSSFIPYEETIEVKVAIKTVPQIDEVRATQSGVFILTEPFGVQIEKDSLIGFIYHSDKLSKVLAPASGQVTINIKNKESISEGDLICVVIPNGKIQYYGEVNILKDNVCKVTVNQKVILKTEKTNDIIGYVTEVSNFRSTEGTYTAIILFANTTHINPYDILSGKIIIEKTTILGRFMSTFANKSETVN